MPKAPRNLLACHQCRSRKVRCDGARPKCHVCSRRDQACHWPDRLAPGNYKFVFVGDGENQPANSSPIPSRHETRVQHEQQCDSGPGPGQGQGQVYEQEPSDNASPSLLKQRLLHIFSETHQMLELCGCIDPDTVKGDVVTGKEDFLLQSIMALSSLYLTDAEAASDSRFATSKSLMSYYRSNAQAASRSLSDEPSVITIQANLVLGLCELLTMATSKAWLHIGLAIRMAQTLRMRRENNKRLIPRQREIRRRTFWACVTLDRLVAYCTFRTQTIDLQLVDLHLPCSDVAFAFGHDSPGPKIDELGRETPAATAEKMALAYFVKTFLLWSPIAQAYVDGGRRVEHSGLRRPAVGSVEYEATMSAWLNSVPAEMEWSERNLRAHQSLGQASHFVNMHLLIQHARFLAHHEHLPHAEESRLQDAQRNTLVAKAPSDDDLNAIAICLQGASKVISMLRLMTSVSSGLAHTPLGVCAGIPLVTTASVLLWACRCSRMATLSVRLSEDELSQAELDLRYLVSALDSWSKTWALARAWANCIRLLDDFYQSKYSRGHYNSTSTSAEPQNNNTVTAQPHESESGPASPTALRDGDGYPDLAMVPNDTYYKVRLITGLILEHPQLCKKFLQESIDLPQSEREPEEREELWDFDFDFSWMEDPHSAMTASTLWTEFALLGSQ